MRAKLTITDHRGKTFVGEIDLSPLASSTAKTQETLSDATSSKLAPKNLDFDLPTRAFLKKYVGGMTGPAKLVLLLASLANGQVGKAVDVAALKTAWNRVTERMGGKFNPAYPTRALENTWISTPKRGFYALRPTWMGIFKS